MNEISERERIEMTPDSGFDLVAVDYFSSGGGGGSRPQLYLVEHFEMYRDALDAKKARKNQEEYLILYRGPGGEPLSR